MPSGGYRRPSNPAPVSGPGALSRRTDGRQPTQQLSDAKYGEQKAYQEAQGAAPMSGDLGMAPGGPAPAGPDLSSIVPFGAPSARPDEPITAGLSGGLGGGPAIPARPSQQTLNPETQARLRSYMPVLVALASQDDADPQTRQFVRQLRAELG